jgi:hypothetical protein
MNLASIETLVNCITKKLNNIIHLQYQPKTILFVAINLVEGHYIVF